MRYEEMTRWYPWIEELFALVAGQVRDGVSHSDAMAFLNMRIQQDVRTQHQHAVMQKLTAWAAVVSDNISCENAGQSGVGNHTAPTLCPVCGSIEASGGDCRWCHK